MIKEELKKRIKEALAGIYNERKISADVISLDVQVTRPKEKKFGDFSTNAAMVLAPPLKIKPHDLAEILVARLSASGPPVLKTELAGPGFVNIFLDKSYLHEAIRLSLEQRDDFGHSDYGKDRKVLIEFVSANPVGPLHVGHGRWAAVGDVLANLLLATGYTVEREFYINDYGNQMDVFGMSVAARYRELFGQKVKFFETDKIEPSTTGEESEVIIYPKGGYKGAYIKEIAEEIKDKEGNKYLLITSTEEQAKIFADIAYKQVLEHLKKTLKRFGVVFDSWFSERTLHESSAVNKAVKDLKQTGFAYDSEDATWLRTSVLGDEKDRVLIKQNGKPTYFAADIAYHLNKLNRGFSKVINIWGADHHGYVARMKAAMKALGAEDNFLEIIIGQLVNLTRGGKPVRMSKRTGEMVTFEELMDDVGVDAARFFFLSRSTDTTLDFDIELAKKQSSDNPVYYVQYAHARICSILRTMKEQGYDAKSTGGKANYSLLATEWETGLMEQIYKLPEVVVRACEERAPNKLTTYAYDLAGAFHVFYTNCRVIGVEESLMAARLDLLTAARIALKNILSLMGLSSPSQM